MDRDSGALDRDVVGLDQGQDRTSKNQDRGVDDLRGSVSSGVLAQQYLQKAYDYEYQQPPLSDCARKIGGYLREAKPANFDDTCIARAQMKPVLHTTDKCGVQGKFIDEAVFKDRNILLEILQNAEPLDSKGTWFGLEFLAKGKWRPVVGRITEFTDEEIEAVRIADNGKGYLPTDLTTLGGGKRNDPGSAGQFGSGMKIADRSALGKGVEIVRYSRNWRASGRLVPVLTSAGHDHTVEYDIDYFDQCLPGSVVEYRNLTPAIFEALRSIEQIYLPLDPNLEKRIVVQNEHGLILKPEDGNPSIYVKGREYQFIVPPYCPLLFAYDLHRCPINDQNRHYVDNSAADRNMVAVWSEIDDPEHFKLLIRALKDDRLYHEHGLDGMKPVPDAFLAAVKECFGVKDLKKAYLGGYVGDHDKKVLDRNGYQAIEVSKSRFIADSLKNIGVKTGHDVIYDATTGVSTKEVKEGYEREDFPSFACRALVFAQSKAQGAEVQKLVVGIGPDGRERAIDYAGFIAADRLGKFAPKRFVIRLNGGKLNLGKMSEDKHIPDRKHFPYVEMQPFIEELALLFASCRAAGAKFYIQNDGFEIEAGSWGGTNVRAFEHLLGEDFQIVIEIENNTQARDLKDLRKYSLRLDPDYKPVESTAYGDVVGTDLAAVYEQGIRKTGVKTDKLILSYDFNELIDDGNLEEKVGRVVGATNNVNVVKAILSKSKKAGLDLEFYEYSVIRAEYPVVWKEAFEAVYGEKAVLDDYGEGPCSNLLHEVANSSGFEVITLPKKLAKVFGLCRVKSLQSATRPCKYKEYFPNPHEAILLRLSEIAEMVIGQELPRGVRLLELPPIEVVTDVTNLHGEALRADLPSYIDPLLQARELLILRSVVKRDSVNLLFQAIYMRMIEQYRLVMGDNEYKAFARRVAGKLLAYETNLDFLKSLQQFRFLADDEKACNEAVIEQVLYTSPTDLEEMERERRAAIARRDEIFVEKEAKKAEKREKKAEKEAKKAEKRARKAERFQDSPGTGRTINFQWPSLSGFRQIGGIVVPVALAALAAVGVYSVTPGRVLGRVQNALAEAASYLPKIDLPNFSGKENSGGFRRLQYGDTGVPNVNVEHIEHPDLGEISFTEAQRLEANTFFTSPALRWGYWMRENLYTAFDGDFVKRSFDPKAPDFDSIDPPEKEVMAHLQIVDNQKVVEIRTRTGGFIDKDSIRLRRRDGTESKNFVLRAQYLGEYEITILDDPKEIASVQYHTVSPLNWIAAAKRLADADFDKLPKDVYEYYTRVPGINLETIPFKSRLHPRAVTLGGFFREIRQLPPYERVMAIKNHFAQETRWVSNTRTENAWNSFYAGKTVEKNLIAFALGSELLEVPGDGDCDVHNQQATFFYRSVGIPARLTLVKAGQLHVPAEVFFPGIGWVEMDTMGQRIIEERRVSGGVDPNFQIGSGNVANLEADLKRQVDLAKRACQ